MRIGLVIYGSLDTLSGGYLYDRKLVEYLRAQGDQVEIISLPWRNYAAHLGDNFSFRLPSGLDILIQDELNHASLLGANGRPHAYPVVSLVHHLRCSEQRAGWQNAFYRIIEKRYLDSVDGFIFNSQTTRGVVTGLAGDSAPALIAYPPTDRFGSGLPAALVAARAAETGPVRILFLGNVISRKGLHTLLEALSRQSAAFRLDVIGSLTSDPAYSQAMQQKAASLGASSTIQFHGPLDNGELAEKLRAAQILVVPSSYEGFGIVYLEGMAFGLPAIGTTAGAASEIISDGETGFLINPDDAETLARRLTLLASDRDLLARMSLNALRRYQQQPTWEQTAAEIRQFLLKMVPGAQ
ncbi:MAG: glycosyltransferase family 4 protein [Chloroflexi bacterium]|nr:glycosyltransferase family 4 protein [Chloroflexota bacterium]